MLIMLFLLFGDYFHALLFQIWLFFVLVSDFFTHQCPQALNPTVKDIRTHCFCFAIQTDSGWAPLLIESLLVMGGSVCRTQQVRKKKKRNLRDASCLSQGENCVGSRNSHNHPPSWPLCMYLWGAHMKPRRLIQMILCRLRLFYESLFFFRGLFVCLARQLEFKTLAQHLSWFLGAFWNNTRKEQHGPNYNNL